MVEISAAVGLFMALMLWGWLRQRAQARAEGRFDAVVREHLPVLLRKRRQLVRVDDYGIEDRSRWEKELDYFFGRVVPPALGARDLARLAERWSELRERVARRIEVDIETLATQAAFALVKTGADFEQFCAQELRRAGWQVTVTAASRDQGADLVARRGAERLVVQCKFLSRPVGNGAVQEVVAARSHVDCNRAVVVSNQRFTSGAAELAASNTVELRHWSELHRI